MSNYFSGIQSLFGAEYYGRHLGLILQEIGNRRPRPLMGFICKALKIRASQYKMIRFQAEYVFSGTSGKRRADLAVFGNEADEPFLLIEIKYNDKPDPGNHVKPAQLKDYRVWRDKGAKERYVLVLSREHIVFDDLTVRRWGELAVFLQRFSSDSDLIAMLVEYLEGEGVVMQEVDSMSLVRFLKRMLCGRRGAGQLVNNLSGPAEFGKLLTNMRLLSVPFDSHFKQAWREAGVKLEGEGYSKKTRIANIDFSIQNRLNTKKADKLFEDSSFYIDREVKSGGRVFVFARYSLGHGRATWLRIEYGFEFEILASSDREYMPTTYLFADAYGGIIPADAKSMSIRKKIEFDLITNRAGVKAEYIERSIHKIISALISNMKCSEIAFTKQQKKAIAILSRSLSSGLS